MVYAFAYTQPQLHLCLGMCLAKYKGFAIHSLFSLTSIPLYNYTHYMLSFFSSTDTEAIVCTHKAAFYCILYCWDDYTVQFMVRVSKPFKERFHFTS